ncbi:MAG: hypothetical protein ACI8ZX_003193 [Planctomycetota bacterium]|jgi:hypothetical protein
MTKPKRKKKHRGLQYFFIRDQVWNTLFSENKVDDIYKHKIRQINLSKTILKPFRVLQRLLFDTKINKIDLQTKQPVFIIGHWRSGTTHLHYVFHKDNQFGTLSNYQTFSFTTALLSQRVVKFLLSPLMPKERTQDNIKMTVDKPGEEEQALSVVSTRTGIHSWIFGKNPSYFSKYNLFKGISDEEKKAWQEDYTYVLKNISFANNNKQLLLKNPHNTSRVKELLEMFPKAKFVFIHRNPLDVYISMIHLYGKVIETQFLQYATIRERKELILYYYKETMQKYLKDRAMIPKESLFEVGFDEFTGNEMEMAEKMYTHLDIDGFENAKPRIQHYLDSVKTYKKNKFRKIDPEMEARIRKEWAFAFEEWGY